MGNKLKWLLLVMVLLAGSKAHATICSVAAGASVSTIQTAINNAVAGSCTGTLNVGSKHSGATTFSGQIVMLAGGTYTIGSQISVPCSTNNILITGPVNNYPDTASARPTAILNNTQNAAERPQDISIASCSAKGTLDIYYLEMNGGRPTTGGGAIYVGDNRDNLNIRYNWIHGNQEKTPYACLDQYGNNYWCYDDDNAHLIWLDGYHGGTTNNGTFDNTVNIEYNIGGMGPGSGQNPSTGGDCSNVMTFGYANFNNSNTPSGLGYDTTGSACSFLFDNTNTRNLHVQYNVILQQEQAFKFVEGGNGQSNGAYSLFFAENNKVDYNTVETYHRVDLEDQQSPVNDNPLNGQCSLDSNGSCVERNFNVTYGNWTPGYGNWGFSTPNFGYEADIGNTQITNLTVSSTNQTAGPGDYEFWSHAMGLNNLSQGWIGCSFIYGFGDLQHTIGNNIFQNQLGAACTNNAPANSAFSINNNHNTGAYTLSNNSNSTTPSPRASTTPTISPNGGTFSSSQVVTITNPGYTSNSGPQGNMGTWCTTDGSTPSAQSGTSQYFASGETLTLTTTTTLKCIGNYGAVTQPPAAAYPSGYGWSASPVVTASFSGGGTPTAAAPTYSPVSQTFYPGPINVSVSSTTPSAIIYCTTNGTTPTTSSPMYSAPFVISATATIQCIATAPATVQSPVSASTYTLGSAPTVDTPTFNPASKTFNGTVSPVVSTVTAATTIYCTFDGSTPTTASHSYPNNTALGPFSATTTAKCLATASGFLNSAVGSATYTYQLYLGNNQRDLAGQTSPNFFNMVYAVTGTNPGGYSVTNCVVDEGVGTVTNGAKTDCLVVSAPSASTQATTPICKGTYTNTSTTGVVATIPMTCPTLPPSTPYWVSSISNDPISGSSLGFWDCGGTCGTTPPTFNNGTYQGRYVLGTYGTYTAMPTALNINNNQASNYVNLALIGTTNPPIITPPSVTFTTSQLVTISDSSTGAVIYYTTDGSNPTTSSPVYSAPFTVTSTTTVIAIAVAPGLTQSTQATATYTKSGVTYTVTGVNFSSASGVNYVIVGSTDQFSINITYSDGVTTAPITSVGACDTRNTCISALTSSNTAVATISAGGLVTGVSNMQSPNWTLLHGTVTGNGGGQAFWIEGVGTSLVAGIQGGGIVGGGIL